MKLSICIAHTNDRASLLRRLLHTAIQPGINEAYEILVYRTNYRGWNDESDLPGMGDKLTRLYQEAQGEWVCAFGDDDYIAGDFVAAVLPYLEVDCVGFNILQTIDGKYERTLRHDPHYKGWSGEYRGVAPQLPLRREIAMSAPFPNDYRGDLAWAQAVEPLISTTAYIDRELYFYDYQTESRTREVGRWPCDPSLVRWF